GIEYVDTAVTMTQPNYMNQQLWYGWGAPLGGTRGEHRFATARGWKTLTELDRRMQERAKELLEQVERDGKIAVLVLNRPYHADPGLHHGIPEELQALGYPILSIRSIPKDQKWLAKYFQADI